MSHEKAYALSLLACVLYSFGLLLFRWVHNYMESLHFPASFVKRIAYGRYQYEQKSAWPRILRDVACCLFCMAVGFVPTLNLLIAVVATTVLLIGCLQLLTEGL